jgi:hypothetical protein
MQVGDESKLDRLSFDGWNGRARGGGLVGVFTLAFESMTWAVSVAGPRNAKRGSWLFAGICTVDELCIGLVSTAGAAR